MSDAQHLELAEEMGVTHTGPPGVEFVYAPIGGARQEPPYDELDPGIRETARWLYDNGFNPTDSGDGVSKVGNMDCAQTFPHVYMVVQQPDLLEAEVERLWGLLQTRDVHLFAGPLTPEAAEELGVSWEGAPDGAIPGTLEGSYAPGGPALIMLVGLNDVLMGLRDGA